MYFKNKRRFKKFKKISPKKCLKSLNESLQGKNMTGSLQITAGSIREYMNKWINNDKK